MLGLCERRHIAVIVDDRLTSEIILAPFSKCKVVPTLNVMTGNYFLVNSVDGTAVSDPNFFYIVVLYQSW